MIEDWQAGGFGLYLHWPFCEAKCPYCDFNSHVRSKIDQSRWNRAYLNEIDRYAVEFPNRVLTSVFFGGGTPSLMDPEMVGTILDRIRKSWPTANTLEVTLEANPSSVEAGRFAEFSAAGINRVSIGVQALNDADLKRLGRLHSTEEALQAVDIALEKFSRVSFDLIYARQDQSLEDWRSELTEALSISSGHLSLYQLTIEPNTAFGERFVKGKLHGLPDEDLGADMYHLTQELCEAAGLPAYEVSNHAEPGAESRHNMIYWRYGDYIGIGPGAHGRLSKEGERFATTTILNPEKWLSSVETGSGEKTRVKLSRKDQAGEYLMMGLRLRDGIDATRYERIAGTPLTQSTLDHLQGLGMLSIDGFQISATRQGRAVLNPVISELLDL